MRLKKFLVFALIGLLIAGIALPNVVISNERSYVIPYTFYRDEVLPKCPESNSPMSTRKIIPPH
jgi:type IV secretory pathway TrbF-like protein